MANANVGTKGGSWTLEGKTCLITGATQGIGRVAARELARLGPRLLLVARDSKRGSELVDEIKKESGNPNIELYLADLSKQADIRRLAAEVLAKHSKLDLLLNNAGAMFTTRQLTADGYETTFALNHLGYFLLTELLLDTLKRTAAETGEARIVNVASNAHNGVKGLDFDDLMSERGYSAFKVYSRSKFANILFTYELDRRLKASGARGLTVNCLHPGFVASGFGHNNGPLMSLAMKIASPFALSPEEGAKTMIYLCTSPEVSGVSGKYFAKSREARSNRYTHDEAAARRLWEASEKLVQPKQ